MALKILIETKKLKPKLTVIGDGFLENYYKNRCHELGMDQYVLFVGRKTKEEISYSAIAPMNRNGFNPYYAYNQVIYLKALDRAKKRLSVKDNRLLFPYKNGIELNISHDLYLFICSLFKECNHWLDSGKYEIIKDEQGLYTVALSGKKSD